MRKYFVIAFLFLIGSIVLTAQDFGDITDEELKMKECVGDPDADAVILFDKFTIKITQDFELETRRHRRIKILTEEGKKRADVKIMYWHEDDLDDLEAVSYSPEGEEFELDSDNIFTEESEKVHTTSFAIPGVVVGSVIEYEYRIYSEYITRLEPWKFQNDDYTMLSEITVFLPKGFNYNTLKQNFELYNITEKSEDIYTSDNLNQKVRRYVWTARNIPALKKVPYVDCIDDYRASIIFMLNTYKGRYSSFVLGKTWDEIAKRLNKFYGEFMEQDDSTLTKFNELASGMTDKLDIAKSVYSFICKDIKTNAHSSIYSDDFKDPESVLEDMNGSSSEKNMLLINMLKHAGLDAKPLLISTRGNGRVIPNFIEHGQFNRVICYVIIDDKSYYLYTGSKANPFGCLISSMDVPIGLLLKGEKADIVTLKPESVFNKVEFTTNAILSNDGTITANTEIVYQGDPAVSARVSISDDGEEETVKSLLEDLWENAELDTFYYSHLDSIESPLKLNVSYSLPDYIEEAGELKYFTPPMFTGEDDNPFVKDKREYSIDYKYKVLLNELVKIELPANYKTTELPLNRKTGAGPLSFSKKFKTNETGITCSRLFNLKSRQIPSRFYSDVKDLYTIIVNSDEEQIVLSELSGSNSEIGSK